MKKVIKYQFLSAEIDHGTDAAPDIERIFLDAEIVCRTEAEYEANLAIAQREAWGGEYTIEDDGVEETTEPTAQDDTDALLVDLQYRVTLLELGLTE